MNYPFAAERVSPVIGLEITGLDLAGPLDDGTVAALRAALAEHLVLFFRDQDLTPAQHLAFAERLGTPSDYPFVNGIDGFPAITPVLKLPHETVNFGGVWHSDTTYLERPPMATLLLARELPPAGGDTLFANQQRAYEILSDGLKRVLDGLRAVNSAGKAAVTRTREDRADKDGAPPETRTVAHPAVRTHPETGRKGLYVNAAHTVRFDGWTEAESAPLLDFLFRHQVREELCCRFRWRPGSMAVWDNRGAQHYPVNDYHGHKRLMHRITLEGDAPS